MDSEVGRHALGEALARDDEFDELAFTTALAPIRRTVSSTRAHQIIDQYISHNSRRVGYVPAIDSISTSRLFVLCPTGDSVNPSWDGWLVADPNDEPIAILIQRLRVAAISDDDVEQQTLDDCPIQLSADGQAVSSRHGLPISLEPFPLVVGVGEYARTVLPIRLSGKIDFGIDVIIDQGDPDITTRAALDDHLQLEAAVSDNAELFDEGTRGAPNVPSLAQRVLELVAAVNDRLNRVLLDPPLAQLVVADERNRFTAPSAQWRFYRADGSPSKRTVPIEALSRAEQQWARASILDALYWVSRDFYERNPTLRGIVADNEHLLVERPVISLFDEPEAAMHRAAEELVATALERQARDPRQIVIAASHSPALLDAPGAHLVEVRRGSGTNGRSVVQPLDFADVSTLSNLGLVPSDLLRLDRVFLLVEGRHDEVVLEAFIGDGLRAARAKVLPLRGIAGDKLRTVVESKVLFESTNAHLVTLVDNLPGDVVSGAWNRATEARLLQSLDAAKSIILTELKNRAGADSEEARWVAEWLTAALDRGYESRITPEGLAALDVIEYLPVAELVPGASSWDELRAEHSAARARKGGAHSDFKKWLKLVYRADFGDEALRRAAATSGSVPPEFLRLLSVVQSAGGR